MKWQSSFEGNFCLEGRKEEEREKVEETGEWKGRGSGREWEVDEKGMK